MARAKKWKDNKWEAGERMCAICGDEINYFCDASVDHIIPLSEGGADGIDNFQLAHRDCNTEKSNKTETTNMEEMA